MAGGVCRQRAGQLLALATNEMAQSAFEAFWNGCASQELDCLTRPNADISVTVMNIAIADRNKVANTNISRVPLCLDFGYPSCRTHSGCGDMTEQPF